MGGLAGMDDDAAPAQAMGVDQRIDIADDFGLRQRVDHQTALPRPVLLVLPMLDGAAAADAEMRTERRDPLRAGAFDMHQPTAVGMPRHRRGVDHLIGQRVRHVDRLPVRQRHAVAEMADMIDGEAFNHGGRR
jgi:hypothetical protein